MAVIAGVASAICLAACQWLIYVYAPLEVAMGAIQKIFYLHLPLALWAFVSFFVVFIASAIFLVRRASHWDELACACAEIGLLFSGLVLITGMIWGKVSWGVWWTWDPRLTTTLVMWFIYSAYLLARRLDVPVERKRLISAVIGIVAFLDVPLVFFSARIFRSIHPAVFGARGGGLEPEMLFTLLACVASLGMLWLALVLVRKRQLEMFSRLRRAKFAFLSNCSQ